MTFFAVSQSGAEPSRMHTASSTFCTSGGGDLKFLISTMSFLESESRALMALFIAGIAASRSRFASSAITCTLSATSLTAASSLATWALVLSASTRSLFTWMIITSVSLDLRSSSGCSAVSVFCMPSTIAFVSVSFLMPTSRRLMPTSMMPRLTSSLPR